MRVFFTLGVTIGLIARWIFRKRVENLPKKIKRIEKQSGHPAIVIYLPSGKEKLPKILYLHGEIPRHLKRIHPKPHPGGRKEGTPYSLAVPPLPLSQSVRRHLNRDNNQLNIGRNND